MPQLEEWATKQPDKTAYLFPQTGERTTFVELDVRSRLIAHWLIGLGLQAGDHIALLMENQPALIDIAWGARRAGLYYTVISTHLKAAEAGYIIDNSESRLLVSSGRMAQLADAALAHAGGREILHYQVGASDRSAPRFEAALADCTASGPLPERPVGRDLLYSSGTTGLPKGVSKPLVPYDKRLEPDPEVESWRRNFGFDSDSVYLSPAPLYHAAPLRFVMRTIGCGGSCIVLSRFDPAEALAAIERYKVTHSQWVPTMFVRMLALDEQQRRRYDVSSMRVAVHAAAPCPVHVKRQMIDWWGPVIWEYYAGSEAVGVTVIDSAEWLRHPGSVGRATIGKVHILGDDGRELPPGQVGAIYFSGGPRVEYYNEPEKTRGIYRDGMATYGDLGYLDEDGFLFLSDRRADLIISGGVNIYPKEIEDVLHRHPAVADCVVIGVPNAEFGEEVKAVVQPKPGAAPDADLAADIIGFCREHLSNIKVPKTVDFMPELPRLDNGKLPRRLLKERYLETAKTG